MDVPERGGPEKVVLAFRSGSGVSLGQVRSRRELVSFRGWRDGEITLAENQRTLAIATICGADADGDRGSKCSPSRVQSREGAKPRTSPPGDTATGPQQEIPPGLHMHALPSLHWPNFYHSVVVLAGHAPVHLVSPEQSLISPLVPTRTSFSVSSSPLLFRYTLLLDRSTVQSQSIAHPWSTVGYDLAAAGLSRPGPSRLRLATQRPARSLFDKPYQRPRPPSQRFPLSPRRPIVEQPAAHSGRISALSPPISPARLGRVSRSHCETLGRAVSRLRRPVWDDCIDSSSRRRSYAVPGVFDRQQLQSVSPFAAFNMSNTTQGQPPTTESSSAPHQSTTSAQPPPSSSPPASSSSAPPPATTTSQPPAPTTSSPLPPPATTSSSTPQQPSTTSTPQPTTPSSTSAAPPPPSSTSTSEPPAQTSTSNPVVTVAPSTTATSVRTVTATSTQQPSITTSSTTTGSTSTPTPIDPSGAGDGGLNQGAKVAIGVVVPIAAIAILAIVGLFWWKKRRARQQAEEERRKEVEDYAYNPNADPTIPAVGLAPDNSYEMREDGAAGYRGWGSTTAAGSTGRKASTTMSGGMGAAYSDATSPTRGNVSDARSGEHLIDGSSSPEGEILGAMGPSTANNRNGDVRRGPSNASSSYSAAGRSDGSDGGMYGNGGAYYDQYGQNPYAGDQRPQELPAQAVIRDNPARRNTRIENPAHYPQQSAGIAQNF
ncbi:Uncharacterized protein TPAR_00167 [Tolypocladium paradoxum]|uniref:Serine-rich protein C11G7.01 n=1 Tax=Tolypocladium paradoxum TaxID=94208 RepID=A0A2S4LB27_9HYPO|nr:Uncharacterized protein TPAR_00167 [Tolypocladium paradoxum]